MIEMQNRIAGAEEKKNLHRELQLPLNEKSTIFPAVGYQAGLLCPKCGQAILDYDGLLNLVCPDCGVVQGGCFT